MRSAAFESLAKTGTMLEGTRGKLCCQGLIRLRVAKASSNTIPTQLPLACKCLVESVLLDGLTAGRCALPTGEGSYLVDPASSHMLVSDQRWQQRG